MKVWARSKGGGPHLAVGLTIEPTWNEFDITEEIKTLLSCIDCIELSESAPSGGEPKAVPTREAEDPKGKKKRG
jgi:hypothetical protein